MKYLYTVRDVINNKCIVKDGCNNDVEKAIGLAIPKISTYIIEGYLYKHQYKITAVEIEKEKKVKKVKPVFIENKILQPEDLIAIKKFDDAMKYLKSHYSKEFLSKIPITAARQKERQAG